MQLFHRSTCFFLAALPLALVACEGGDVHGPADATPADRPAPLATVNGVPIHEADVQYRLDSIKGGGEMTPLRRTNLLERVIEDDLQAQRAREL